MMIDLTNVPPELRSAVVSLQMATRQKWFEAATTYFSRAILNRGVTIECQIAGFNDAAGYFAQKAIWLVAQGVYCSAKQHEIQTSEFSKAALFGEIGSIVKVKGRARAGDVFNTSKPS